jgi:tetratricopeptide (TPR) repeat protein
MAQIKSTMESDNRPYFAAAQYYIDNGKDLNKAVEWLDKAYAQNPDAYWVMYQKARALKMLGKKGEAIAASNKSIELAKKGATPNADYVKLNEDLQKSLK